MKETGIIMSGDHPVKILDGTKTMTRRTYGLEKINEHPDLWLPAEAIPKEQLLYSAYKSIWRFGNKEGGFQVIKCPYGQVGDRLWVRETWAYGYTNQSPDRVIYKADNTPLPTALERGTYSAGAGWGKWAPSIHMFRKDSRITLEITELWAELLRSISPADAMDEGGYTVEEFIKLYLNINHLPDDANPWNWAIKYKLLGMGDII